MSFSFKRGTKPLLISFPHNGSTIPDEIGNAMTDDGLSSRDTDWYLDRLYDFPDLEKASVLTADISRYVIDLNRPSTNESLYPGQTTTGLIPQTCFDGAPIYKDKIPDDLEIEKRIERFWTPYHQTIQNELERLTGEHGVAVLLEAHSIASKVPRLFDGQLPDFNLGTHHGKSCSLELEKRVISAIGSHPDYSHVVNERFVGGFITRRFGDPENRCHSLQIELSQATYLCEETRAWDSDSATKVQQVLQTIIQAIDEWLNTQKN